MKAVGYEVALPIDDPRALIDFTLPDPVADGHDLLVRVEAVSVNPVDTKVRRKASPEEGGHKVLGYDAAGVVEAIGGAVTLFKPGDRVWYAGSIARPGTNSERHLVDERIVGRMPASLGFVEAAAMPLTSITAWELLFDRLQLAQGERAGEGRRLLVVGASGGVGSILVQLARQLTGLTVIGTASRPETQAWVKALGAHHVIDHGQPLDKALQAAGLAPVDYVVSLTHTDQHFPALVEVLKPQGKLALIDDPAGLNVLALKGKSLSLHWESMFTRSLYGTEDMSAQHHLLNRVAELVDAGRLRTTLTETFGTINAANLRRAHALIESHKARGKIVLAGFEGGAV